MDELNDLPVNDPLFALLDRYEVMGSDIESRVLAQVEAEELQSLRAEVAALHTEVQAMRSDIADIKRILLTTARASTVAPAPTPPTDMSFGTLLLPYARREEKPLILG